MPTEGGRRDGYESMKARIERKNAKMEETLAILDELAGDIPVDYAHSPRFLADMLASATQSNAAVAQMLYDELRPNSSSARDFIIRNKP